MKSHEKITNGYFFTLNDMCVLSVMTPPSMSSFNYDLVLAL